MPVPSSGPRDCVAADWSKNIRGTHGRWPQRIQQGGSFTTGGTELESQSLEVMASKFAAELTGHSCHSFP